MEKKHTNFSSFQGQKDEFSPFYLNRVKYQVSLVMHSYMVLSAVLCLIAYEMTNSSSPGIRWIGLIENMVDFYCNSLGALQIVSG